MNAEPVEGSEAMLERLHGDSMVAGAGRVYLSSSAPSICLHNHPPQPERSTLASDSTISQRACVQTHKLVGDGSH